MKYYLGLDMGTNSVGWAATDPMYKVIRLKGKDAWGVRLFERAQTSGLDSGYRTNRTNRRRLARSNARIGLLRSYFLDEIDKVDPNFFARLENSRLHMCDKDSVLETSNSIFSDKNYSDKDYYNEFPTVFHLRKALVENENTAYDIRLVYLALLNMFKHRGHFLLNSDGDNLDKEDIESSYSLFCYYLEEELEIAVNKVDVSDIVAVLADKSIGKRVKAEKISGELNVSKNKQVVEFIKCLCGSTVKTEKLFNKSKEESVDITFASFTYEDEVGNIQANLTEDEYSIVENLKTIYDFSRMSGLLDGGNFEYLSQARVALYEKHNKDLRLLKRIYKKHLAKPVYDQMFRSDVASSYSAYVNSNLSDESKKRRNMKARKQFDLYDKIKKDLKGVPVDKDIEYVLREIENETFLPKQLTAANGIIPNQLHAKEMKKILSNAEKYLPFLLTKDESGLTVSERIVALFTFQIPYYIGPTGMNSKNGWAVRKETGDILPWNIWDKIDKEKTSEAFITNMIRTCSYIEGEKVMPKSSLLYEEYCVLNELNCLCIKGNRIDTELKNRIYNDLFKIPNGKRIKRSTLAKYLITNGIIESESDITGVDESLNNYLPSYGKMYSVFGEKIKEDKYRNLAEEIIYWGTIYSDSKTMFKEHISKYIEDGLLIAEDVNRLAGYKFKDWSRLSKEMLLLSGCDKSTGEIITLIDALRLYSLNFMELINSGDFTFKNELEEKQRKSVSTLNDFKVEDLNDYYFSAPVRRMIWQTLLLIKEIIHISGEEPEKIFIEMTRSDEKTPTRKNSRGKKLVELYKNIQEKDIKTWLESVPTVEDIRKDEESGRLKSKKLYLYYMQLGRDVYTGKKIELSELFTEKYDIDHIYPRSKAGKDDSLISNLVLVDSKINRDVKRDLYPLPASISGNEEVKSLWRLLHSIKTYDGQRLMSDEKFKRLSRRSELSDEELSQFIARQLVETSQATKSVASILKQLIPSAEIVYSRAENVSDFRLNNGYLKSRVLNEFHHAKDAYLNVVVGNVYNTKFTKHPYNFIKNEYRKAACHYNLDNKRMFDKDVKRGDYVAWTAGKNGTISIVEKMMNKNTPIVTKLSYDNKGALFNVQPCGKNEAKSENYVPLKGGLQPEMYGGYSAPLSAYFVFISYEGKGGRIKRAFDVIPKIVADKLKDEADICKYLEDKNGYLNVRILCNHIKKEALVNYNGYLLYIAGVDSRKNVEFHNATSMCLSGKFASYVHRIEKSCENNSIDSDITSELNESLYKELVSKHVDGIFKNYPRKVGEILEKGANKFASMDIREQVDVLYKLLSITSFNSKSFDMSVIQGPKDLGRIRITVDTSKASTLTIINQSITGLYCEEINLLAEK